METLWNSHHVQVLKNPHSSKQADLLITDKIQSDAASLTEEGFERAAPSLSLIDSLIIFILKTKLI